MHKSVLLEECLLNLNLKEDSIIVDCTLGYAGHSSLILKKIKRGFLFAFDQDLDAINYSQRKLSEIGSNFEIIHCNFVDLKAELQKRKITHVDGFLFDLGVSSPQLDNEERGFSFHANTKLDMRMNQNDSLSAYDVVNDYSYEKLIDIFYRYGEEVYAKNIAKKIIDNRPITTTGELVEIITAAVPYKYKREKHPARKVFQALRIEVNKELEVLETALQDAINMLNVGGRICVITFHSLEDRICKQIFKEKSSVDKVMKNLPHIPPEYQPTLKLITNKPIIPNAQELDANSRSRSAKLRVAEKIK